MEKIFIGAWKDKRGIALDEVNKLPINAFQTKIRTYKIA